MTERPPKLLIVEDEPAMARGLRDNFEFEGYEVLTAANGEDGLGLALDSDVGLVACMTGLALGNFCLGLIVPTTMVLALDDQGEKAGLASSLGGTLQMLTGGVMVVALGPVLGSDPLPMIAGVAFSALMALILTLLVRPQAAGGSAAGSAT